MEHTAETKLVCVVDQDEDLGSPHLKINTRCSCGMWIVFTILLTEKGGTLRKAIFGKYLCPATDLAYRRIRKA